jgi:tRNA(His) 5'-end guanylyltransferase
LLLKALATKRDKGTISKTIASMVFPSLGVNYNSK